MTSTTSWFKRSASPPTTLPRFLLSLSASSTSSQQPHGAANSDGLCSRIAPAAPPDSACRTAGQDIELVALHTWRDPSAAESAAEPRIAKHKRASPSPPAVSPSAVREGKSASADRDPRLTSRSSTTSLAFSASSDADSPTRWMTPVERQNKANQIWRGYW